MKLRDIPIVKIEEGKKLCIGTCVENPFDGSPDDTEILCQVVELATEISRKKFMSSCYVSEKLEKNMLEYPGDYTFYENKNIMFFEHSGIEHFYE